MTGRARREVVVTEQIDLLFTDAVRGMRGADAAARRSSGEVEAGPGGPATAPRNAAWTSSTRSSASRHLDLAARWLRAPGQGFYTIGSAGHEGNAAVAAALRPTDPALLHYRSGAFYLARARQVPGHDPRRDVLLGRRRRRRGPDRRWPAQGVRPAPASR